MNRPMLPIYGLAATLAGLTLWFVIDPLAWARVLNEGLINLGFPILFVFIALILCTMLGSAGRAGAAIAVAVIAFLGIIGYGMARSHHSQLYYASTIEESDKALPAFGDRAPHQIAARQATSNLSGIVGVPERTAYLPSEDAYTTLVARPGMMGPGYTGLLSQTLALTGQAKGSTCTFDERANRRMDGHWGFSLTRAIAAEDARLIARKSDAWGYCDGDTPQVVVPVTKLEGWLVPHHVPAGVAIYDGESGDVDIVDGKDAAGLPGPVIGIGYSELVNRSLESWGGTWWTKKMGQTGLTDEVKDGDDTNALNASNFVLAQDGQSTYVSPFTSRAASVTVDAVAVLDASTVEEGEPAKVTLHHLETPRASNAATADRIKSDYASLPGWATGLQIQEIVPAGPGIWAASIGLNQNVTHRVLVRDDGSSCLQDARGNKVRCTDDPESETPSQDSPAPSGVPDDISALDNQQLAELQDAVTREILQRLAAKQADG